MEGLEINLDGARKAFKIANNAIYFDDNSDYRSALWEICKVLSPKIDEEEIGSKYYEEDEK